MALSKAYGLNAGWPAAPGRSAPPAPPGSPDTVAGMVRLIPTYTGPCARLYRASDGAVLDVGWSGFNLDFATLNAFDDGTLQALRFYDQKRPGEFWGGAVGHLPTLGTREQIPGLPSISFDAGYQSGAKLRLDLSNYSVDRRNTTVGMVVSPNVGVSSMRWFNFGGDVLEFGLYSDFDTTNGHSTINTHATTPSSLTTQITSRIRNQPQAVVLDSSASALTLHYDTQKVTATALQAGTFSGGTLGHFVTPDSTAGRGWNGRLDYWAFVGYPASQGDTICIALREYLRQYVGGYDAWSGTVDIVFGGDSLTEGHKIPRNRNMPHLVSEMLGTPHAMHNCGRYGYTQALTTSRSAGITDRYNSGATKNIVVMNIGVNDIFIEGVSLATMQTRLAAQIAKLNQGWDAIVWQTIAPIWYSNGTAGKRTILDGYNQYLRDNYISLGITHLVDLGANAEFAASAAANDTACYIANDGTHWNEHGATIAAALTAPVLKTIIG